MKVNLGLPGLLVALTLAGLPGVSSAAWCSALSCGLRYSEPREAVTSDAEATDTGKAGNDSVFKLTCRSCRRGYSNYPAYSYSAGYGSYYPSYSYYGYSSYSSYYPTSAYYGGYSTYYPSYGYSASYTSYYPVGVGDSGCGCLPRCGCASAW